MSAAPVTASVNWIGVGSPSAGIYDIICQYLVNGLYSLYYFQYDSNLNSGALIQTLFTGLASSPNYFTYTPNGKYFGYVDPSPTYIMKLF